MLVIRENVPLKSYTTLRVGGPARYFVRVQDEQELVGAFRWAEAQGLSVFVLGGGSNLLVSDAGFPGLVVHVALQGLYADARGDKATVIARAGEQFDEVVGVCAERNFAGMECLSGIPGSAGATPVQNVGAYGQEVKNVIKEVKVYDIRDKLLKTLSNRECNFGYRKSQFNTQEKGRYVIVQVVYELAVNGTPTIAYPDLKRHFAEYSRTPELMEIRNAVLAIRKQKAMLSHPHLPDNRSVGSFFKNPIVQEEHARKLQERIGSKDALPVFPADDGRKKVSAAWLIERAGFPKGHKKGRAGISPHHALSIINLGDATAAEIVSLMHDVQEGVKREFDIELVPEPEFVGF